MKKPLIDRRLRSYSFVFYYEVVALDQALREADGQLFAELLSKFIEQSMSYHLFVLGLLVTLAHRYAVRSNRESGYGRYDIMLIPHDKSLPGLIIEFKKKGKQETLEECADRALEHIKARKYAADLQSLGFNKIDFFGVAFYKKDVLLKQESAT